MRPVHPDTSPTHRQGGAWSVLWLILVFPVLWTLYASLSRYQLDRMGDMVENYAWGIGWQFGYYKHPPLYAWITAAWFSVFPRINIFYHLLAAVSATVALWAMWRISARYFSVAQQRALVMAAFFLPPLTFLTLNYNATSAMLPFWALTFLFYLRTLEKRRAIDALLLGVLAGCSILTKYHSIVLVLAIALHALADREVRPVFATKLPWLAMAAGLATIAPHIRWMFENDLITVRYAASQGEGDWLKTFVFAFRFLPTALLYALPLFAALGLLRRPGDGYPLFAWRQVADLWKSSTGRALVFVSVLPPLITLVLGVVLDAEVSSLWAIPFFVFLALPITALLPKALADRSRVVAPVAIAIYALALIAISPLVRDRVFSLGKHNSEVPVAAIAQAAERVWHENVGGRLAIVAAPSNVYANAAAFYADDRPFGIQEQKLEYTPWVTPGDIMRDGAAYICTEAEEEGCRIAATTLFGRVDEILRFSVPAPDFVDNAPEWKMLLIVRRPERQP